ncbi:MAG: CxxxxCH/CxxCH domain-containing protein [Anaeromyxobacter sp.]
MIRNLSWAVLGVLAVATFGGCDSAREVPVSSSVQESCTRCHGYPPSAATGNPGHPQNTSCSACHPTSVEGDNQTIVAGGTHANGHVDVFQHPAGFAQASQHGPAALQWLAGSAEVPQCASCHGENLDGGGAQVDCGACHSAPHSGRFPNGAQAWSENCTFCHGQPQAAFDYETQLPFASPPVAVSQAAEDPAIGAHHSHVFGGPLADAQACASCHSVPPAAYPASLDHVDGSAVPVLGGLAAAQGVTPSFDAGSATCTTYCHGKSLTADSATSTVVFAAGTSPAWSDTAGLTCAGCHGAVPSSGLHAFHVTSRHQDCGTCHQGYEQDQRIVKALHVNGNADVVTADGHVIPSENNADRHWGEAQCADCHTHLGIPVP